jgi:hypothetical protein
MSAVAGQAEDDVGSRICLVQRGVRCCLFIKQESAGLTLSLIEKEGQTGYKLGPEVRRC